MILFALIKLKNNVYEIVTDLPESSNFIQTINSLEEDNTIQAIIIINENNCFGNEEYEKYINSVFSHGGSDENWTDIELSNRTTRERELVILNKVIKKIINSSKLFVSALQGEVVTPFFGASLACDIRLISQNTHFIFSHVHMNIHPSGAVPYFLPKFIGHAKATEILYSREKLSAAEASELGLVMSVLPSNEFESSVIKVTKSILSKGTDSFLCTKKLLNC